ncbi:MAG: hypothetical protein VYE73_18860, partial [Acidobacteriota bacterium]|nr:hypothetical protein [Acidobacteriota bacterium]
MTFLVASILALSTGSVAAQDCRIRSLGGPNRFSQPVTTVAALKALFRDARADFEKVLADANWDGSPADLFAAVESGDNLHERMFAPGQRLMWMALRRNGEPTVLLDECWGGESAYQGFELQVDSRGSRYTFSIPQ